MININLKRKVFGGNFDDFHNNVFDDFQLIKSEIKDNISIDSIKVKKLIVRSNKDFVEFINFVYQIGTGEDFLEIQGHEINCENEFYKNKKKEEIFLEDFEEIIEFGGSFRKINSTRALGGIKIKTSKNKNYKFGCFSKEERSFKFELANGGNLVFCYQKNDFINGIGVHSDKLEKFGEKIQILKEEKNCAQEWLRKKYPHDNKEEIISLNISKKNLTGALDLSDFINLKELNCSDNEINYLNLRKNIELEFLNINNNNFPKQNPDWLSHLVKLKELRLKENEFYGYLDFTKEMKNLKTLEIDKDSFKIKPQHLPSDFEGFYQKNITLEDLEVGFFKKENEVDKFNKELKYYDNNLRLWQSIHPNLLKEVGKDPVIIDYKEAEIKNLAINYEFFEKKKEISNFTNFKERIESWLKEGEEILITDFNYSSFLVSDPRDLFSKEDSAEYILPTRLYQISTNKVILTKNKKEKINYVALSYVWGDSKLAKNQLSDKQKQELDEITSLVNYKNSNKMTKLGYKSWLKSISTCRFLGFDYLWIDQLCINQNEKEDKENEVGKMGACYGNCNATLISIEGKIGKSEKKNSESELIEIILKKIVNSPWFSRSWTFQEGFLSKRTIFVFDDALIDGRLLATAWGSWKGWKSSNLNKKEAIYITPLGWSYQNNSKERPIISLGEAFFSIKNRQRTISIDGVYSILGLLPYGDKVKPNYKEKICKECKKNEVSSTICSHFEKTECPNYFIEDLEKALIDLLKEAFDGGRQHDVFSWSGFRNSKFWYLPQIDESGSANIETIISGYEFKEMKVFYQGIHVKKGEIYIVDKLDHSSGLLGLSKKNLIHSGCYKINLKKASLDLKIDVGDRFVIIGKDNSYRLSILLKKEENTSVNLMEIELEIDDKSNYVWYGEINKKQSLFADLVKKVIVYGEENINDYNKLLENGNDLEIKNLLSWNAWKYIDVSFNKELVEKWKEKEFDYEEAYYFSKIFNESFDPKCIIFYEKIKKNGVIKINNLEDFYNEEGRFISNKNYRQKLISDYYFPYFNSHLSCENSDKNDSISFNDIFMIGKACDWNPIQNVLIKEIKINKSNDQWNKGVWIDYFRVTYLVKSQEKWKLVKSDDYDKKQNENFEIIKLSLDEYLTKIDVVFDNLYIERMSFYISKFNEPEKIRIFSPYGEEGKKITLLLNNEKKSNIFWTSNSYLSSFGLHQSEKLEEITKEDEKLIEQIEDSELLLTNHYN